MAGENPTAVELFTPTESDYAVDILRRIFGETVIKLLGGDPGQQTGHAVLASVLGTFNIAILFFATIIAAFMMYQLFLDTARDGEVGGRENNVSVTALRAGVGAGLLLPVSGGFSVIQILIIQLLLWGSGLGDTVWTSVASEMQTKASYTASSIDRGDSYLTARKMAGVLATRVSGHLCVLHANNISKTLGTGDDALSAQGPFSVDRFGRQQSPGQNQHKFSDSTKIEWYFGSKAQYDYRMSMCGRTTLLARGDIAQKIETDIYNQTQPFAEALTQMTERTVLENGMNSFKELDAVAKKIATEIYEGKRDTNKYKTEIKQAVGQATGNFISGVTSGVTSSESAKNLEQLKKSFLESTTTNGWMFAATWQRALASYITKLNSARNQLEFVNNGEVSPKTAGTRVLGSLFGYSDTEKRLFASVDQDFDYLTQLDGAYVEAGEPNPTSTTTLEKVAANNQTESSILAMQRIYSTMFDASKSSDQSERWNDPLIEIQELGQNVTLAGGVTAAGAWVANLLGQGAAIGVASTGAVPASIAISMGSSYISDVISYFGYALIILGVILCIILPFLPFAYYLSGVVGWVIMAIEAVVAAPIWTLLAFAPHKTNDMIGTNKQGLLLMIGVFLRPVLMVIGLLACFLVLRVGLDFVNIMFTGIYMVIAPENDLTNMFLAFGLIGMYVLTVMVLVTNCAALITGLCDAVMEFVGVRVQMLGQNSIGDATTNALNPTGRATGAMEGSVNQMGQRTSALGKDVGGLIEKGSSRFLTRRLGAGGGGRAG